MKAKKSKTFITLLINCILIGFTTVISICSLSIAWFGKNEKVNGNALDIEINKSNLIIETFLYQRDLSSSDYHGTDKDSYGDPLSIKNLKMHTYDTIFEKMNKYTSSIIRFKVKGEKLSSSSLLEFKISRDFNFDANLQKLDDKFTSIIAFGATINSSFWNETENKGTDVENVFDKAIEYFEPSDENASAPDVFQVFPEKIEQEYKWEKKDYLTFNLDYSESDFDYENADDYATKNNPFINVYVFIGYSKTLINEYKDESGLNTRGLNETLINFGDDIKSFEINAMEN